MIILDTSIWIEFFRGHEPVFTAVAKLLESRQVMGLPWVFGELLQGARDNRELDLLKKTWRSLPKLELPLLEEAWLQAGIESQRGKWHAKGIGLIDAAIVSAAGMTKAPVATLDKKLLAILRFKKLLADVVPARASRIE